MVCVCVHACAHSISGKIRHGRFRCIHILLLTLWTLLHMHIVKFQPHVKLVQNYAFSEIHRCTHHP